MQLRTSLSAWTTVFFATLGLSPLVACGGTTVGEGHAPECRNPKPHLGPDGKPTGLTDCEGGSMARVEPTECGSTLPRPEQCAAAQACGSSPSGCSCLTDADCTERANGYCGSGGQIGGCYCSYGCRKDADCGSDMVCLCGDPVGQCVSATCSQKSDCPGTNECLSYTQSPGCPGVAFACQNAADTCASDADCTGGAQCSLQGSPRRCTPMSCTVGRPFLVGGAAMLANAVRREDWTSALVPGVTALEVGAREKLARHWTDIALMEHASIAAFARFALEAISLGAPPELLALTHAAMADETVHARDAFALASGYAGRPIGPGALAIDRALTARSARDVLETTILEGCIGETVAAVEGAEALAHATDPAVREALARVTVDETRHAELAWRFVRWALENGDRALSAETARLLVELTETEGPPTDEASDGGAIDDEVLRAHGMLGPDERCEIRRRVLRDIVQPCARSLVASICSGERMAA